MDRFSSRLIYLIVCLMVALKTSLSAELRSIGIPKFQDEFKYFESSHPLAFLVKKATTKALLRLSYSKSGKLLFLPSISNGVKVSSNGQLWEFSITKDNRFTNGQVLTPNDISFSINHCKNLSLASFALEVSATSKNLVSIQLQEKFQSTEDRQMFIRALASCPILEASSSVIFGEKLGSRTSLVSAGDYYIRKLVPGKRMELAKSKFTEGLHQGPKQIEVKSIESDRRGITALRYGNIDLLFLKDKDSVSLVANDETMQARTCGEYHIIQRRGLHFICNPEPDFETLRFNF